MDTAAATEMLTSTLNGFKLSAKDVITIVDKLIAVDNIAATSVAELGDALRKTANVARESGVNFDQLVSYIAVVSSVTRKSADSIGTSFQAMFSRLENIKLGRLDEEGATLNDVEKTLARVNIKLRVNETTFRDMSDVLTDVANKWDTFNQVEQASIAQAIAGKYVPEHIVIYGNINLF